MLGCKMHGDDMVGEINFGILDPNAASKATMGPIQGYNDAQQNALSRQNALQSNQLNALSLQKSQQEMADDKSVRNALSGSGGDWEAASKAMMENGQYKQALELKTKIQEQKTKQIAQHVEALKLIKAHAANVFANPTLETASAAIDQIEAQTGQNMSADRAQLAALTSPEQIKQWAAGHALDADKMGLHLSNINLGGTEAAIAQDPITGKVVGQQVFNKTRSPDGIAADSRAQMGGTPYFTPVQTAQGVMSFNARTGRMEPVAVAGAPVVGSASDPKLQGDISGAKAAGKVVGEKGATAMVDLPSTIQESEQTIKLVDDLLKHPGFKQAVGGSSVLGVQKIPGTDAKAFMTRLDQLKGKQFLQAYQGLKGGGQITEVEGQKATDAISRMNNSTTEPEFIAASREFQDIIRKGVTRAKEKSSLVGGSTTTAITHPDFPGFSIGGK